ncbi:MAG TPA: hypothetical protein VJN96_13045 [Vicinamibacterales bacterium]|nr:hypothetical protein [Vicinamibacterales bacterium]
MPFALPPTPKGKPPTYRAIAEEVRLSAGFVAQTCCIADVLRQMGYPVQDAPNRKGKEPVKPCPPDKVDAIRRAIERKTDDGSKMDWVPDLPIMPPR